MALAQITALALSCVGMWRLRGHSAHLAVLALTIAYVLLVPGPIAYERFRVPVTSLLVVLIGVAACPRRRGPHCLQHSTPLRPSVRTNPDRLCGKALVPSQTTCW